MTYTPLISAGDISGLPLSNVIAALSSPAQTQLLTDASRAVENYCGRLLAPFTGHVERHRAQMTDPDAQADIYVPLDLQGTLGTSRARSLGANDLVRHVFLKEYPPVYPEMWTGSITAITVTHAIGGATTLDLSSGSLTYHPETGQIMFPLGTYIVIGDLLSITYAGGYSTVPDDLKRATVYEAIEQGMVDIFPAMGLGKDLDMEMLTRKKAELLDPYVRDDEAW